MFFNKSEGLLKEGSKSVEGLFFFINSIFAFLKQNRTFESIPVCQIIFGLSSLKIENLKRSAIFREHYNLFLCNPFPDSFHQKQPFADVHQNKCS